MADDLIEERTEREGKPDPERVASRAKSMEKDKDAGPSPETEVDDSERAAEALLAESEERTEHDPAPRDLKEGRVERRTSDDATPPPDER